MDFKCRLLLFFSKNRRKLVRLPVGVPILILLFPLLVELFSGNLLFLRDWVEADKYYLGFVVRLFVGSDRLFLWLHVFAVLLFVCIVLLVLKVAIWNRVFPLLVLKDAHRYSREMRVYWYTDNFFERLFRKVLEKNGLVYEPKEHFIWVNRGVFFNFLNPYKSVVRIRIPDPVVILERSSHELVVDDIGIIHRFSSDEWELTWEHNITNEVVIGEMMDYIEGLLVEMADKTSKASKSDPHIRKKVIMDSTFTQASSVSPKLRELVGKIREERGL